MAFTGSALVNLCKKTVRGLENPAIPLGNYFLTFFFAITLRNYLEMYSDNEAVSFSLLAHYYLSYICLGLALVILFHYAAAESVAKTARVVLPGFIVLPLAPALDLLFSKGRGYDISYLLPGQHDDLVSRFFTFGGPFNGIGATPGMRIEIGIALAASCLYFFTKRGSIVRSLAFTLLAYCVIFLYGAMLFVVRAGLSLFHLEFAPSNLLMRNVYLLVLLPLGAWVLYLHNRTYFQELLEDSRFLRVVHYELMVVLGAVFARTLFQETASLTTETLFYWPFIIAAIACAGFFSLMTNNLADYAIDFRTNPNRPSVTNAIPHAAYKKFAWVFFFLAVIYALAVHFTALFFILLVTGNYYLYSMPPLRLKRMLFLSKLCISINSLALFTLGFFFISGSIRVPAQVVAFFLICLTAAANVIDIKDYEGDRAAGISTLPTVLGLHKSKMLIGLFFLMAYLAGHFIIKNYYALPLLAAAGALQFFCVVRKNYSEKPILIIHTATIVAVIGYFFSRIR